MTLKILIALMMSAFREAQADESVMISLLFLIQRSAWKEHSAKLGFRVKEFSEVRQKQPAKSSPPEPGAWQLRRPQGPPYTGVEAGATVYLLFSSTAPGSYRWPRLRVAAHISGRGLRSAAVLCPMRLRTGHGGHGLHLRRVGDDGLRVW